MISRDLIIPPQTHVDVVETSMYGGLVHDRFCGKRKLPVVGFGIELKRRRQKDKNDT